MGAEWIARHRPDVESDKDQKSGDREAPGPVALQRTMVVGAQHDPQEREADSVAQAVTAALQSRGPAAVAAGGRVQPLRGAPSLAPPIDRCGEPTIRRKMAGTHAAMERVKAGRGARAFKTKGAWTATLKSVEEYEQLEATAFSGGKTAKWKARAKAMRSKLDEIIKNATSWLDSNGDDATQAVASDDVDKFGDLSQQTPDAQTDAHKLAAIRNVIRRAEWEKKQINRQNVSTPGRSDSTMSGAAVDNAVGGQASSLDQVTYKGPQDVAATTGFFQPDKTSSNVADAAAGAVGIPGLDPNWSGRSMAAANLDRLITDRLAVVAGAAQLDSLVTMNFATHTRTPQGGGAQEATTGVYLEKAEGLEMRGGISDAGNAIAAEAGRTDTQQMAFDDPVLQRSLNKLQLLDALCGQVDRHNGNFFVDQDAQGRVTGVEGIDNDMAFGKNLGGDGDAMRAAQQPGVASDLVGSARAWKGLPPIADAQVAQVILAISAQDIQDALEGLISPEEIAATLSRLAATKTFLAALAPGDLISPQDWDQRKTELAGKQQAFNSYLGAARTEALGVMATGSATVRGQLEAAMEGAIAPPAPSRSKPQGVNPPPGVLGTVPEYQFAEGPFMSDVQNLISRGVAEPLAITRGEALARHYALDVAIDPTDRSQMSLNAAMKTVQAGACAHTIESSRRTLYTLWG